MHRSLKTLAAGLLASAVTLTALAPFAKAAETPVIAATPASRFDVKALVITMFDPETKPWRERLQVSRTFEVAGAYSPIWCNDEGVCVLTTGMGKTNAGVTMANVLSDPQFDLSRTIFLTAGIAGTAPQVGTLGDAAWADHVIDFDLGHHVLPEADGSPDDLFIYAESYKDTGVYTLNKELVDLAYDVTKGAELLDGETAKAYRALYGGQANRTPKVLRCDTVTGDNYWHGRELSALAADMIKQRTNGAGTYCSTQMEDNASAGALARAGYLDRYLSLRTMSNFDQPHPGQTVRESLNARSGGFPLSIENEYRVGKAFVNHLLANREAVLAKTSGALTTQSVTTKVGAQVVATTAVVTKGRTLLAGAPLAEALGATYTWAQQGRTVKIVKNGQTVELLTDRPVAIVGGKEVALEVGARIDGAQVLVPLRYVAEALGFHVTWDAAAQTVQVAAQERPGAPCQRCWQGALFV